MRERERERELARVDFRKKRDTYGDPKRGKESKPLRTITVVSHSCRISNRERERESARARKERKERKRERNLRERERVDEGRHIWDQKRGKERGITVASQ